jgi:hypothetical protein
MKRQQNQPTPQDGLSALENIFGADTMRHFPKALEQEAEEFLASAGREPYKGEDARDIPAFKSMLRSLPKHSIDSSVILARPYPPEIEEAIKDLPRGWCYSTDPRVIERGNAAVDLASKLFDLTENFDIFMEHDLVITITRLK